MKNVVSKAQILLKNPVFWLRFAAYAIPACFLLYVLYWNFLPFGYDKTFVINVGAPGDTSGEFYLETSKDLSEPKVAEDGSSYRELNGIAYAVFKPKAVLKNADISVSVEGDDVSLIAPHIDFDPSSVKWDYAWDFTKSLSRFLKGDALYDENQHGVYFDGTSALTMPTSASLFEKGPFSVYAEWMPQNGTVSAQQIVGHYNWELWQNSTSVEFRVGRMNDATGPAYSVKYPIVNSEAFFNAKHSAVAVYNPGENGYIELFVDGNFADRVYIGTDTIWKDYGSNNLSFGWSPHNYQKNPYLLGYLYQVKFLSKNILNFTPQISFKRTEGVNSIPIISTSRTMLKKISLYAKQG